MSKYTMFRFVDCPLPSSQSPEAPQKNYVIEIKAPLADSNEYVYAFVTEHTGGPVFGEQAIVDLGISRDSTSKVYLVCDDRKYQYPLELLVKAAIVGGTVPDDYIQLGWETIDSEFTIKREVNGCREIIAKIDHCTPYHSR